MSQIQVKKKFKVCTQTKWPHSFSWFLEVTRSITVPPLDGMPIHYKVSPLHFIMLSWKFARTHLFSWMVRVTLREKTFAKEHNTLTRPGLWPRPLNLESSSLTTNSKPPYVPWKNSDSHTFLLWVHIQNKLVKVWSLEYKAYTLMIKWNNTY